MYAKQVQALMAILLLAILPGCTRSNSSGNAGKGAEQYVLGDPIADADAAIKRADYHLVGINRFTTVVPGVNGDYGVLRARFEILVIPGTSDVIDIRPNSFNKRAEKYAIAYNQRVFAALGCNLAKPMDPCRRKVRARD
jgi:hypothetical protein